MASDHYRVLGIAPNATPAEVKAAFRKLAHRYHPDISSDPNATEKFIAVVAAYRALTSEATIESAQTFKKTTGKRSAKVTPAGAGAAPSGEKASETHSVDRGKTDTTRKRTNENFTGGKKAARDKEQSKAPVKGKDCHIDAHVSIEELYWGAELKVNPSSACLGRRSQSGWKNSALLKVKIPRGTRSGTRVRVRGKGMAGENGGAPGDIYLTVLLKPHERYEVDGDNVYVDMPLTRWEAQQGVVVDVVTPGGRIEVNVPAHIGSGQSVMIPRRA